MMKIEIIGQIVKYTLVRKWFMDIIFFNKQYPVGAYIHSAGWCKHHSVFEVIFASR